MNLVILSEVTGPVFPAAGGSGHVVEESLFVSGVCCGFVGGRSFSSDVNPKARSARLCAALLAASFLCCDF
jgi:hypothetical protein